MDAKESLLDLDAGCAISSAARSARMFSAARARRSLYLTSEPFNVDDADCGVAKCLRLTRVRFDNESDELSSLDSTPLDACTLSPTRFEPEFLLALGATISGAVLWISRSSASIDEPRSSRAARSSSIEWDLLYLTGL